MNYYPCFISFRHFDDAISEAFINQFVDCLKGYLNPLVGKDPFVDFKRMEPGYSLQPALANALCNSACMVVIWSPQYFNEEHLWCAMEYKAMIELEKKRLSLLPAHEQFKKLIIPVIYKGSKYYPADLEDSTLYLNLEKFSLYETEMIKNKNFATEIERLANYIYDRIRVFNKITPAPWGNCGQFQLPSKQDAIDFVQNMNIENDNGDAFPFR